MKYSAIEELYLGKRGRFDQIKNSDNYTDALDGVIEIQEKFFAELKKYPELAEIYEKLEKQQGRANSEEAFDFYSEGFRFGFLLGLDVAGN